MQKCSKKRGAGVGRSGLTPPFRDQAIPRRRGEDTRRGDDTAPCLKREGLDGVDRLRCGPPLPGERAFIR